MNGPGDDVARGEIALRVLALHEPCARPIHQRCAFAPQGFAGQGRGVDIDGDGGGVKLDEFGIGDPGAGQGRQGQALAANGAGVGGDLIEAAEAARGEDCRRRDDLELAAGVLGQHATHSARGVAQQGQDPGLGADLDKRRGHCRGGHGAHDLAAGLVALDPGHAGAAVGGLEALDEVARRVPVEGRAEGGQGANGGGAFAGEQLRHRRIDEAGAGGHRVGGVQGRIVILGQGHGQTALRPGGRAALQQRRGAQHQGLAGRAGQGRRQAGEARTDNQDALVVQPLSHGRLRCAGPWRSRPCGRPSSPGGWWRPGC